ncbi:hypothetical protein KL864_33830 [Mycolicibacterium goodii]|uniref:hypothetical protein n=1 Tax=Mycolicibacterium goodii TaxID=134601 RepID=UPI001BDC0926|nr:hypothetical protein [Mycolicibacterium goodii]MBU8820847.1 hypothetical protein [Mycolicibacterium goodii]
MAKKGVFTDELGDIDDLLPASIPSPYESSPDVTPPQPQVPPPPQPAALQPAAAQPAPWSPPPAPGAKRATSGESVASVPSAQVDPAIHDRLVKLTAKERARNTTTARTFAQVVLDAVEKHQGELAQFWMTPDQPQGTGLFRRQKVANSPKRRRRHDKPPARIPLGGIDPVDLATLDKLAVEWNAGSRSALVEQALRFEFNMPATPS